MQPSPGIDLHRFHPGERLRLRYRDGSDTVETAGEFVNCLGGVVLVRIDGHLTSTAIRTSCLMSVARCSGRLGIPA